MNNVNITFLKGVNIMFIYKTRDTLFTNNLALCAVNAEIRNVIQNWRKENELPIDYKVPTLYVYFKEPIIKSALIDGRTHAIDNTHLFKLCQIENVEFKELINGGDKFDFYCWSPLGGTIGHGNVLNDTKNVIKTAIENKYYDEW